MSSSVFLFRKWRQLAVVALAIAPLSIVAADLSQAVVRQKVNVVTRAASLSAPAEPVGEGAVVRDENVVRTGSASRAELEFPDLTLARLGANALFSFDAQSRVLNCTQGAALFSKPTNSGRVEIRAGAITAAITGSTGFVSNQSSRRSGGTSTMVGMIEGKIQGTATWRDAGGREHSFPFRLGAGEMMVAQPGKSPLVVQFDIPRFLRTSPLVKGFKGSLPNMGSINRAVADFQADAQRGFIRGSNILVSSQPLQYGLISATRLAGGPLDVGPEELGRRENHGGNTGGPDPFVPVGGTGTLRGQLVWDTSADLDLHLTLPDNQHVFYGNRMVSFNNGRATAELDKDNLGGVIDQPPSTRVENIVVNGVLLNGSYVFYVNSFRSSGQADPFTLRVSDRGNVQTINGTLTQGQNSTPITINFTSSGR